MSQRFRPPSQNPHHPPKLAGFIGVTACLWRDQLLEEVCEVSQDPLRIAAVVALTVATMSTSCIIKDEVMG